MPIILACDRNTHETEKSLAHDLVVAAERPTRALRAAVHAALYEDEEKTVTGPKNGVLLEGVIESF